MTIWKLTERIVLVEGGVKVFEDTDWKEHRANIRQGIMLAVRSL